VKIQALALVLVLFIPVASRGQTDAQIHRLQENFTSVSAFGPFKVTLRSSGYQALKIDDKRMGPDDVVAEVDRGVLVLRLRNRRYLDDVIEDRPLGYIPVIVYYTELEEIKAHAGAIVQSEEPVKARNLLVEGSKGAEVRLQVLTKNLYVKSNMGASIFLSGKTHLLEVFAGMGADLNCKNLLSSVARVKASMGSYVHLHVQEELSVRASFGSEVRYSGKPRVTNVHTLFGSELVKASGGQ
jgi:hypothetical protein